jgi:hypothetical protein
MLTYLFWPLTDRGVNTFSPEGRLFQVEYAIEAIKLGSTSIGISTPEGVVLGVEKRVQSKLLEATSIEKIMEIDAHLGCAMSGLTADARTMIEHARVTSQVSRPFSFRDCVCCSMHRNAGLILLAASRITPLHTTKKSRCRALHRQFAIWRCGLENRHMTMRLS